MPLREPSRSSAETHEIALYKTKPKAESKKVEERTESGTPLRVRTRFVAPIVGCKAFCKTNPNQDQRSSCRPGSRVR